MTVHIDEKLCKGCGLCIYYCNNSVLQISDRRNQKGFNIAEVCQPENCNTCRMCEINCPDFSIYVEKKKKSSK
jgi:2-oxoglutarate ferredoxin oxidoreductase subunit delta